MFHIPVHRSRYFALAAGYGLCLGCLVVSFHHGNSGASSFESASPTRPIELRNAIASITGHLRLDDATSTSLGSPSPDAAVSLDAASLIKMRDATLVVSLGEDTYGNTVFLRTIDQNGTVRHVLKESIVSQATDYWPFPQRRQVLVHLDRGRVQLSSLCFDLGVVDRNTDHSLTLNILNSSSAVISVSGFEVSCSCISTTPASGSEAVLKPSEQLSVDIRVSFGKGSELSQMVRIGFTEDGANRRDVMVGIFGSARKHASWQPSLLDFGVVGELGAAPTRRLRISEAYPGELEISRVEFTGAIDFAVSVSQQSRAPENEARDYWLSLKPSAIASPTQSCDVRGEVVVLTTSAELPVLTVPYLLTLPMPESSSDTFSTGGK